MFEHNFIFLTFHAKPSAEIAVNCQISTKGHVIRSDVIRESRNDGRILGHDKSSIGNGFRDCINDEVPCGFKRDGESDSAQQKKEETLHGEAETLNYSLEIEPLSQKWLSMAMNN